MNTFRSVINGQVIFSIPPDSLCPCGSQKFASNCCLTISGFRKIQTSTSPSYPKTGKSLKSCYASCLADCDSILSREHYISETLLHYLSQDNGLKVVGFPWIKGKEQVLSPNALASKMLCGRHNSALSKLDDISIRLFQAFDEEGKAGSGRQLIYLFSGHDLERWLLKILCGIAHSKNIVLKTEADLSIPEYWLRILFGEEEFPDGQGLYVCISREHIMEGPRGLQLRTITGKGRLSGIGVWICPYELILSMSGFHSRIFDGRKVVYRPLEFHVTGSGFEKSIIFSWDGSADLGTISFNIDKQ
ncbi:hypothetical protein JXA32_11350 [Candidatus Sumerlaeota bacterium]|nr:hypothetical protein [Candidatus Sumerlaeota bacterium]